MMNCYLWDTNKFLRYCTLCTSILKWGFLIKGIRLSRFVLGGSQLWNTSVWTISVGTARKFAEYKWRYGIRIATCVILMKFDLDSLNASEEEWKLVTAFAQINLSLLISYCSSILSEIGDIILELGRCQGWALTSIPSPMRSRNPNQTL